MNIIDFQAMEKFFVEGCAYYVRTAPVVARHLDEVYVKLQEDNHNVGWLEMLHLFRLHDEFGWLSPHYAANMVYKIRQRFGYDVTGMVGF